MSGAGGDFAGVGDALGEQEEARERQAALRAWATEYGRA